MDIKKIISEQNNGREKQMHGIFASLFILQNRLQTAFDNLDPNITIKQFMLLLTIQVLGPNDTFTNYAKLLGCSRQNIKKLMTTLEQNHFIELQTDTSDNRKSFVKLTEKTKDYFLEYSNLHLDQLKLLFKNYTDEEIQLFYEMIVKLYDGIERIENN